MHVILSYIDIKVSYKIGQMAEFATSDQGKYQQLIIQIVSMATAQSIIIMVKIYLSEYISSKCMKII
jgi:hypothetical protein